MTRHDDIADARAQVDTATIVGTETRIAALEEIADAIAEGSWRLTTSKLVIIIDRLLLLFF